MIEVLAQTHAGKQLLQALREMGYVPDAPCGGNGTCGKCRVWVDGREVLACRTVVDRDMMVQLPKGSTAILMEEIPAVEADGQAQYALAYDVGTTTLVCSLLDGRTGKVLRRVGCLNPQSAFGADVISRIQYVMDTGSDELTAAVRGAMEALRRQVAGEHQISMVSIVGNTAMHHLLLGIDPQPLTVPPYMPNEIEAIEQEGVRILPNIAGFVGSDTVGCMLAAGFDRREKLTLLIDIGTNGEMVLGNKDHRIACSTAAGPAFEGAKISCGMRGAEGAVDHVWLKDGVLQWSVIGGGEARGLCGSGLLDLVACLLEQEIISQSGRMECEQYRLGDTGVVLTQKDVREVQLAKAAIRAGVELLCKRFGVTVEQIREVLLAGAFGNYLDPGSACAIGMLPPQLLEHIAPVGNAAGTGAAMCAVSRVSFDRAKKLAEQTQFLELASMAEFRDCFVDCLSFGEDDDD